jgi:scaffold Nfu/NifU family protein
MATATPSPTPNPNAMKYTLDVKLPPGTLNLANPEAAADNPFAAAVFAVEGVQSLFGVNDFVTVTRKPGADWEIITAGVQKAAAEHL